MKSLIIFAALIWSAFCSHEIIQIEHGKIPVNGRTPLVVKKGNFEVYPWNADDGLLVDIFKSICLQGTAKDSVALLLALHLVNTRFARLIDEALKCLSLEDPEYLYTRDLLLLHRLLSRPRFDSIRRPWSSEEQLVFKQFYEKSEKRLERAGRFCRQLQNVHLISIWKKTSMPTVDLLKYFQVYVPCILSITWVTLLVAFVVVVVGFAEGLHSPEGYIYLFWVSIVWLGLPFFAACCL